MRLVRVLWSDACGGERQGWRHLNTMLDTKPHGVCSVGFLLHKGDDCVIVCPHVSGDQGDGEICIPAPWVTSIEDLGPKQSRSIVEAHESENDE